MRKADHENVNIEINKINLLSFDTDNAYLILLIDSEIEP